MQTPFQLPNGDTAMVTDTATAGRSLGRAVEAWREGATEPLFYGSEGRPEGVVISFDQWAEYVTLKEDAEDDRRREEIVRRRLDDDPSKWVSFEDAAREGGWDLDVPPGPADDPGHRP
jgi:hypothetical protein